ncbi:MAG: ester cyclase [Pseudomonadota bacterium]
MIDRILFRYTLFILLTIAYLAAPTLAASQEAAQSLQEQNKALARSFYEDLWFNKNTDRYQDYLADSYVVHDIGEDKGVVETAIKQKEIADFFWANGDMGGIIDYQLAEDDLVATRWRWQFEPTTFLGRILHGRDDLPIINVFRFEDGKIVEIWNHRHDIDTGMPLRFTIKGFLYGLLIALIALAWAFSLRRKLAKLTPESAG